MTPRSIRTTASLVIVGALALSACSGQITRVGADRNAAGNNATQPSAGDGDIPVLHLAAEIPNNVGLKNFNPYSPNPVTKLGLLYEPLMYQPASNCELHPWLATEVKWIDNKTIELTLREGVKWSDGKPFTAKDVVFTLNLLKKYPALDIQGIWNDQWGGKATDVNSEGNKVTIMFSTPAVAKFPDIIGLKPLPEHIYSKITDPVKYIDTNPVVTGPYKLESYNGQRLVLDKREDYWQADKIRVKQIIEEGNYDATGASLALSNGKLDAYWGEIPNVANWGKQSKYNNYWYAPAGSTVLTPNTEKKPFNDPAFRNAYTHGIDKEQITKKATYGVMGIASQSGLKLPQARELLPEQYRNTSVISFDINKANQMLDEAGYKVGSDGFRANTDGSPLQVTVAVQAGWIDYDAAAAVIVQNLRQMKINTTLNQAQPDAVDNMKKQGNFDIMLEYLDGGCTVARTLGSKLYSKNIPTQTTVYSNVQRWNDPATDQAIVALSQTTDEAQQKKQMENLVETMMTKSPVTPLFYAPARMIFRTDKMTGWPSADDPYSTNSELPLILTHLTPAAQK